MVDTVTIIVWLIIAGASFMGEMIIPQFFLLWFGIGAVAGLVAHFLGVAIAFQWIIFAVISGLGLFSTRRFAKIMLKGESKKSAVFELIDQEMMVTATVDNIKGTGQVQSGGQRWRAISEDGSLLEVRELVKVVRIEGVSLVVKRADEKVA